MTNDQPPLTMASDFSRSTFDAAKHYSGVLMQQGRVQLDADWNEQLAIQQHRTTTETIDVVGPSGVPKGTTGFQISYAPATGLGIGAGRFYLGGLLCRLDTATNYRQQPYYPAPDGSFFGPGNPAPLRDGTYVAYLDAWQREVNFRDDLHMREVALGEADTATRQQTVWQVRLLPIANPGAAPTCQSQFAEWLALTTAPTGLLAVQTAQSALPRDPCSLPPTTGYRRLENQYYRVEVQQGGNRSQARFKWSRDNASVETSIELIDNARLVVTDLGRDEVLGFANGQWVEVVDDISTLNGTPTPLLQIVAINPDTREVTLSGSAAAQAANPGLKLRRWDQAGAGLALNAVGAWLDLEDGIQVQFSAGQYRPGDYWTFPARTATGDVEWPQTTSGPAGPQSLPPMGVRHHYARLALVRAVGGVVTITDCRKPFPPLTAITASDVSFDNNTCQLQQARTVQEALDLLCQRQSGPCTLTPRPGPGWEAIFNQIPDGGDAQICFPVGTFPLQNPALIRRKGHLKINGSGPGTRILARSLEAALVFESCESVLIRDIFVETSHEIRPNPIGTSDLNGALTFINCPSVDVEQVDLKCGAGPVRAATCVTVRNSEKQPGNVRVHHCDLQVGHLQQGILVVNANRASIADNTIRTYGQIRDEVFFRLMDEPNYRAANRAVLFRNATLQPPSDRGNFVTLQHQNNPPVSFQTHESLRRSWPELLRANPFNGEGNGGELIRHLKTLASRLLTDAAFRQAAPRPFGQLVDLMAMSAESVASQGITLGGRVGRDLRVQHNTVSGAIQGIHIGMSRERANNEDVDRAETVLITGNTLDLYLPPSAINTDRHGIFVGNVDSLVIENNTLRLERGQVAERIQNDGIRVWGYLGHRVLVSQNFVALHNGDNQFGFHCGIRLHPLLDRRDEDQWLVLRNVASRIEVSNGATQEANTP